MTNIKNYIAKIQGLKLLYNPIQSHTIGIFMNYLSHNIGID
jgi:hypothetical protein